jgi:hypothetical protein
LGAYERSGENQIELGKDTELVEADKIPTSPVPK